MSDTDKIIEAVKDSAKTIADEVEKVVDRLDDHEKRLQKLETAVTVHGIKIGAIVAAIMAFGGITWNVIKEYLGLK